MAQQHNTVLQGPTYITARWQPAAPHFWSVGGHQLLAAEMERTMKVQK
jgi:hypothetical protein